MSKAGPRIFASQVGYLCGSRKRMVVAAEDAATPEFAIQDMGRTDAQPLGAHEGWKAVFRGKLVPHAGPMGRYLVGDFSALETPGVYRAALGSPGDPSAWSYPFVVADGVFSRLPALFLDYLHGQRCGDFQDDFRGPCHLDDGVRSDNGLPVDAAGGWHDAGDLRKWMATTSLPILGLFEMRERLGYFRNNWRERPHEDDLLAEASWGIRWILKMQDPATGMFSEDVGGGGESRREPGMTWWYENHAGCYADNAGNFFSDNRRGSGDERVVRVQYNPVAQYVAETILLEAVDQFHAHYPAFSQLCREAAMRSWDFMKGRSGDNYHGWTSVASWRLLAALRLHAMGLAHESDVTDLVTMLIGLQSERHGFWFMDSSRKEPYRGIIHSAQPVIALASFIESDYENPLVAEARDSLERCRDRYVLPALATNPFGVMPYGVFSSRRTPGDVYHDWNPAGSAGGDGLLYRFFMPEHAPERVNHGLSGHWTSWAHGLALMGRMLDDSTCRDAAFDQLAWLMGSNPLSASMISGVGCRNATPYSRYFGTLPGGFSVGPRGTESDEPFVDREGRLEWSSGEYWLAPLANTLLALSCLLPPHILPSRKLG
jgi:hypothetical protein